MSDRTATPAPRAERSREDAADRPARRLAREDHAEGARGTHDVATIPVAGPRAVTLWRRPAIAAGAAHRRPVIQAKRRMSRPRDPCEREADAVAARVVARRAPAPPAPRRGADHRPLLRARSPSRGPPGGDVPTAVEAVVDRPAEGQPLHLELRRRIEPHVGADLGRVRVRHEPEAARAIGARAFTSGTTIFLGPGESAADVALIAHEATHVVQQSAMPAAGAPVMRQLDLIEGAADWVLEGVRSRVRALPGYTLLTQIAGVDLLTGRPVSVTRTELIQELLAWGPFAPAVGPVLQTIGVVDDLFTFISQGLSANNLTLERLQRDVDAAWARISLTEGIEGNLAIVRGYVDTLLADVRAFVGSIVHRVLEVIRAAVAAVAEPLLQAEPIRPVWELAKKVLHYDPLLGRPVEATTAEILADFLRLIGQEQRLAQMEERGTLQETADWLDTQLATFSSLVDELGTLFSDAWAAIQPENLPGLLDTLPALANRAFGFISRVRDFATTVIGKVLELIKNALLGWLSEHAYAIPGFRLLTVIIGRNPFTGEAVERTAASLIGGFIALLPNGEATYQQLAESGVIAEAGAQIESAMSRLNITLDLIVGTFRGIWDSLTLDDLLAPVAAFDRIVAAFGEPLGRIFEFVGVVVETVISLVLRLMNFPSDLLASIIANVAQAITDIQRDPVRFLLNLLEALKQGFTGFFNNILTYLLQGLTAWLFRGLGQLGITIPADLSLQSILALVLQVLGLTVDYLWTKLGEHIGPERVAQIRGAIDRLDEAWAFIQDVQQRGLIAVWEYIASQLGNLWDTLLGLAQEWIMTTIVNNVVARLLSMLDPTGVMAVVNSFIAFFNAVQSAIEYLRDILEIINRYVTTLAQIAAGNITPGAQMLEQALAAAIPIAIGFLANQVGIGNVPDKIAELIGRLRELIDQAIDWLIQQAIRLGQAALTALGGGREEPTPAAAAAAPAGPALPLTDEERTHLYADVRGALRGADLTVESPEEASRTLTGILNRFAPRGLKSLTLAPAPDHVATFHVQAHASDGQTVGEIAAEDRIRVSELTSGFGTTLIATLNGEPIGTHRATGESQGDHAGHAETWLLLYLTGGIMGRAVRGRNELDVRITRSPCPDCQERILRRLDQLRELGFDIHLTIHAASVHRWHTEAGVRAFVSVATMDDRNITLAPWDILSDLENLGVPAAEADALRNDPAAVARLQRRLGRVTTLLDAIARIRADTGQ